MTTSGAGPQAGDPTPPSVRAARLHARARDDRRAYPPGVVSQDPVAVGAELAATQALLRAETVDAVSAVVRTLVHDLGGSLVPARYADPVVALPVDVSLGLSEPLLPVADPVSVAAMRLTAVLPQFLEAARLVSSRIRSERRRDTGMHQGKAPDRDRTLQGLDADDERGSGE